MLHIFRHLKQATGAAGQFQMLPVAPRCSMSKCQQQAKSQQRNNVIYYMFARPLHFCCQQLSQASCSTTGSTKIEGKSSLKDARTGHDDEIASKSSENRSGLSRAGKCQRGRALKSCSNNRRLKNMQVMFARPLHFCCQQLSQASCSTTGSTKIEGKSSLKDARTGHDDEIASKSTENRSGLSNSAPRVA